ncbi:nuclear transport factor 2 family protein [Amycolatopsis sp. FDAARGOS 1241]|uniref:nuclear transport factor 2 family protein n=1 Tax=Amycolatopsis sp. FDAARGOS 1241 TaxID=2778070 RepID=UPI00194E1FB0|nr:nuclear transport factor 2 family protein [Amycolatopsis sp. FDAARGOS 1241]QRP49775.1 nuclear transport factor 2 family protein [Amycolatopsis sp. FDAARGOS 1241]
MSAHRDIENLIFTYAAHVDSGDFADVGELFAHGTFSGATPATGREAVERCFRDTLVVHPDGTARTRPLTTNVRIDVDEPAGTATAHSYWTALQAVPGLPLQPIASGHYDDRFERCAGTWRFTERRPHVALAGDLSHHLKAA